MRKVQYLKLITYLQPQMNNVKLGRSHCIAFLHNVPFCYNGEDYKLKCYIPNAYAEITKKRIVKTYTDNDGIERYLLDYDLIACSKNYDKKVQEIINE